jgi:8-oxo-dGTP pyrophosphatase MutT (NUDIX family)
MNLDPGRVRQALARQEPRRLPPEDLRPAAVLVPLYNREGEDYVLFTRRTDRLRHHRGEISFPGGRREPDDGDLVTTALRETREELGIAPDDVKVLGRLDDFFSVYGYHVTPYVGFFPWPYPLQADPGEIAEIIEVPLARFRDPAIHRQEDWQHRGRVHPVDFYSVDHHEIWGLTAAILRQFLQRLGLAH